MTKGVRTLALAAASALLLQGCGSEVVIRITTRVYEDGSASRRVEIRGRTGEGEVPEAADWLREDVGLDLASRDAWRVIEESPGYILAEAFADSVDRLPPVLAHRTDSGWMTDRSPATLEQERPVIYERRAYRETYGDPFGPERVSEAIDAVIELGVEALRHEVRRDLGAGVATTRAESFLRTDVRRIALDLVEARREAPGERGLEQRRRLWAEALASAGMRPAPDEGDFWDAQQTVIAGWLRERIASGLSTRDRVVAPEELTFLPVDGTLDEAMTDMIVEIWGGEDELLEKIGPDLEALGGFYDASNGDRYRFEVRLELPGMLIRTNGTPTEDGVLWYLRGEDLAYREAVFEAESLRLDDEALRSLGARRRLDAVELLRLRDILTVRDTEGVLRARLDEARRAGDLGAILEGEELAEELAPYAVELLEILDPDAR